MVEIARVNLSLRRRDLKCRGLGKIQDRPGELESSLVPTKWLTYKLRTGRKRLIFQAWFLPKLCLTGGVARLKREIQNSLLRDPRRKES